VNGWPQEHADQIDLQIEQYKNFLDMLETYSRSDIPRSGYT